MPSDSPIVKLEPSEFPPLLHEIPDAPKQLFLRGTLPHAETLCLAVVGSRDYSNYGKQVVEYLVHGLRGYPIAIVSGLALGIDALAHEAALDVGLYTLAVPGSGLDNRVLYPRRNRPLAQRILEAGGGLLSEFESDFQATTWSFPQRNRIMAGLSRATLVIEAGERSGTLITARLTAEYNRELLVVPGNIFSEHSKGPHQFLKIGATPVTTPDDILSVLGIEADAVENQPASHLSDLESRVLEALQVPQDRDSLIRILSLSTSEAGVIFMQLELNGHIREMDGVLYRTDH
jgi:DNA processing protein